MLSKLDSRLEMRKRSRLVMVASLCIRIAWVDMAMQRSTTEYQFPSLLSGDGGEGFLTLLKSEVPRVPL